MSFGEEKVLPFPLAPGGKTFGKEEEDFPISLRPKRRLLPLYHHFSFLRRLWRIATSPFFLSKGFEGPSPLPIPGVFFVLVNVREKYSTLRSPSEKLEIPPSVLASEEGRLLILSFQEDGGKAVSPLFPFSSFEGTMGFSVLK